MFSSAVISFRYTASLPHVDVDDAAAREETRVLLDQGLEPRELRIEHSFIPTHPEAQRHTQAGVDGGRQNSGDLVAVPEPIEADGSRYLIQRLHVRLDVRGALALLTLSSPVWPDAGL